MPVYAKFSPFALSGVQFGKDRHRKPVGDLQDILSSHDWW